MILPDFDPIAGTISAPALSVTCSTYLLREYIFTPSGIEGAHLVTLRSIRYGSSLDAHLAGVTEPARLAQGGWRSASGARPYLDHVVAALHSPPPTNLARRIPTTPTAGVGPAGGAEVGERGRPTSRPR